MLQHIAFSFLTTISVVGLLRATWEPIVACLGTNPYVYRVLLSFFLVTSLYFVVGSLFAVMDLTLSPKALRKYKTQVGCALRSCRSNPQIVFDCGPNGFVLYYIESLIELLLRSHSPEPTSRWTRKSSER